MGKLIILLIGAVLGGYLGIYLGLYGGIVDIINGIQTQPVASAGQIAFGVVRILILPTVGWIVFVVSAAIAKEA